MNIEDAVIDMPVVCPDGVGNIIRFNSLGVDKYIVVKTAINNRECMWAPHNVNLIYDVNGE